MDHVPAVRALPCDCGRIGIRRRRRGHRNKGDHTQIREVPSTTKDKNITSWLCVYGLVARGIVFAVTGILFTYAGFRVDPDQAGSMSDALQWLRQLPFGSLVYMVVAAGLAAFGVYNLVEARYRIVRGPPFLTSNGTEKRLSRR